MFSSGLSDPAALTKTESKGGRGSVGEGDLRLRERHELSESTMLFELSQVQLLRESFLGVHFVFEASKLCGALWKGRRPLRESSSVDTDH